MTVPTFGDYPVAAEGTVTFDPDLIQPGIGQRLEPPAGIGQRAVEAYDSAVDATSTAANTYSRAVLSPVINKGATDSLTITWQHEDDFPVVSAPRGGIVYQIGDWVPPAPPRFPRVARTWKATRVRVAQLRAAVRRAQDAHAVWAGTKQALTDHEIDELRDDD